MKVCRSRLAKTMLEDLKFSGLQGEELDAPLYSNGVTLVGICLLHILLLQSLMLIACSSYLIN